MNIAIMGKIHPDGLTTFKNKGINYKEIENFEKNSLIENLKDVEGIVLRTAKLDQEILSKCKNLKIVSRHGVGYDNVDSTYLNQNNIALAITGTSNSVSVAEHVMTMILSITKNIYSYDKLVKSGNFKKKYEVGDFFELYNKNIFILGFGRIGKALAKRCIGFEMNVYVFDPFVDNKEIQNHNCIPTERNEGFKIADYISIHLPLNDQTRNLISFNQFKIFKKNLILINTARGGIINEEALFKSLESNNILGAGLDVYENEPPNENHPLFSLNNIILTPHNAALTLECRKRMSIESCENVFNFLSKSENLIKSNIINLDIFD